VKRCISFLLALLAIVGLLLLVACVSKTTPSEVASEPSNPAEVTSAPPTEEKPPEEVKAEQEKLAGSPSTTAPKSEVIIECDPVSGRAGQIILTWKSSPISTGYQIQIALDEEFAAIVTDIGGGWDGAFYYPPAPESPALVIPAGGGRLVDARGNTWTVPAISAGKTYYWRVKVRDVATGDALQSPWSSPGSFTVKPCSPVVDGN